MALGKGTGWNFSGQALTKEGPLRAWRGREVSCVRSEGMAMLCVVVERYDRSLDAWIVKRHRGARRW